MDRGGACLAVLHVRDGDAVEGDRSGEVERPVEWIDDPEPLGRPKLPVGALLGQDRDRLVVAAEAPEDLELGRMVRGGGEVRPPPLAGDDRDLLDLDALADRERGLGRERRELRVAARRRARHQASGGQRTRTRSRKSFRSKGFAITSVIPRRKRSSAKCPTAALMNSTGIALVRGSARM